MGVKEDYFKLKEQWIRTRGSERERAQAELDAFFDGLNAEERELVNEAVAEDFARIHQKVGEAKSLKKRIDMRERLEQVLPFISVSEFARVYFGKSASWMHQRINGNAVHGKVAEFTPEELKTLTQALEDVASRLMKVASTFA